MEKTKKYHVLLPQILYLVVPYIYIIFSGSQHHCRDHYVGSRLEEFQEGFAVFLSLNDGIYREFEERSGLYNRQIVK